jgi:hypothetical protein
MVLEDQGLGLRQQFCAAWQHLVSSDSVVLLVYIIAYIIYWLPSCAYLWRKHSAMRQADV